MDLAVILGGDTLFGEKIAERLIGLGMRVVAFGGDFGAVSLQHVDYRRVSVDPLDGAAVDSELDRLAAGDEVIYGIILAGRVSARQPLESVHPDDLAPFIGANIHYPLRVIHRLLPGLIRSRGYLMRLGWNGRGDAPGYSLDAMVEGAWHQFFRKLFDDVRDTGVKISTVFPESNPVSGTTTHSSRAQSALNPELVGEAVESVFRMRESNLISEIVIRPQATREEPKIPQTFDRIAVSRKIPQLPEKENLADPVEPIQTPVPQRPAYAPPPGQEEDDDDDDIELDDEELKLLKTNIDALERSAEQSSRRRRGRRRRGGRGRSGGDGDNRDQAPAGGEKPPVERPSRDSAPSTGARDRDRNRDRSNEPRRPRQSEQPPPERREAKPEPAVAKSAAKEPQSPPKDSPAPKKKTARKRVAKKATAAKTTADTAESTPAAKKAVRRGRRAKQS
jgi:NADP-dependent 3-hydroxy acid dehydrogenase YdfG